MKKKVVPLYRNDKKIYKYNTYNFSYNLIYSSAIQGVTFNNLLDIIQISKTFTFENRLQR